MNAAEIVRLLARRHREDLFFTEVKDGPTWGASSHFRLDALTVRKSWSPVTLIGYEVKVARGDWMADHKWQAYTRYCHRFSLVCPRGVVREEEVPAGIGLIHVTAGGAGLLTARKAVHREVEVPCYLLLYLLMNRVVVARPGAARSRAERVADWSAWLQAERDAWDVGMRVRQKTRDLLLDLREKAREAEHGQAAQEWVVANGGGAFGAIGDRLDRVLARQTEHLDAARERLERAAREAADLLQPRAAAEVPR